MVELLGKGVRDSLAHPVVKMEIIRVIKIFFIYFLFL
jgi:hypothetical protein